jgi:hypothetical protein
MKKLTNEMFRTIGLVAIVGGFFGGALFSINGYDRTAGFFSATLWLGVLTWLCAKVYSMTGSPKKQIPPPTEENIPSTQLAARSEVTTIQATSKRWKGQRLIAVAIATAALMLGGFFSTLEMQTTGTFFAMIFMIAVFIWIHAYVMGWWHHG